MSSERYLAAAILVIVLLMTAGLAGGRITPGRAGTSSGDGHMQLTCETCHGAKATGRPGRDDFSIAAQGEICTACHAGAKEASHPSGLVPVRALPAAFPLSAVGELTCSSCHDLHGGRVGALRSPERGLSFCLSCHEEGFFEAMADAGQSLVLSGHLDARTGRRAGSDPYSFGCLSCHEDKATSGLQQASLASVWHGPGGGNHPIGRDYEEAARYGGYRPSMMISKEILLPGGRVGCVSCHRPYSRDHGRQPATRGGLCVECHAL